jgi:hypothetical protein
LSTKRSFDLTCLHGLTPRRYRQGVERAEKIEVSGKRKGAKGMAERRQILLSWSVFRYLRRPRRLMIER